MSEVKYYKYQINSWRRYYGTRDGIICYISNRPTPTIIDPTDLDFLVEAYPEHWSIVSALEVLVVCGKGPWDEHNNL